MWHGKVIRQLVADLMPDVGLSMETRRVLLEDMTPRIELHLQGMYGLMHFLVMQLACLFNGLAIFTIGRPYHMADETARRQYLAKVQSGSLGPFKDLIKLVHSLTLLHFYSRSEVLQDMGYPARLDKINP